MSTIFINIVGGPCCGKTTVAAALYSELKKKNCSVVLLLDEKKKHILQDNTLLLSSQISLFGEDLLQMNSVNNKVNVCIRDTSLLNNIVYDAEDNQLFHALVIQEYKKFTNVDFFINRGDMMFDESNGIYTYEQSLQIDKRIKDIYNYANIPLFEVDAVNAVQDILNFISSNNSEATEE